jgi:DNA-binding beta-propeller fold protein YncE
MIPSKTTLARLGLVGWAACANESPGVDPPSDNFYFPSGLAIDPAGRFLYVSNANSDLRFNAGTLIAVDLDRLPPLGEQDGTCPCEPDPTSANVQACDASCAIADVVRIGNFGTDVRVRAAGDRIYLTVRDRPSAVEWIDVDTGADAELFDCGQQRFVDNQCDSEHIVDSIIVDDAGGATTSTSELLLPDEPYGLLLIEDEELPTRLLVTHLATGQVSLLDDCSDGLRAIHTSLDLFGPDPLGRRGAFALAPRGAAAIGPYYVTGRAAPLVTTIEVDPLMGRCDDAARVVPGVSFSIATGLSDGSDARGITFGDDGNRAFVVDREPPVLIEVDTSIEDGVPRNRPLRTVEICPEPSLVKMEPYSDRLQLWVVCFGTSQMFVVDGDLMEVVAVVATGRGPNDLAFDPDDTRRRAYVTNFGENTIGIIDLDPTSPTYRFMVRRIGFPEPLR